MWMYVDKVLSSSPSEAFICIWICRHRSFFYSSNKKCGDSRTKREGRGVWGGLSCNAAPMAECNSASAVRVGRGGKNPCIDAVIVMLYCNDVSQCWYDVSWETFDRFLGFFLSSSRLCMYHHHLHSAIPNCSFTWLYVVDSISPSSQVPFVRITQLGCTKQHLCLNICYYKLVNHQSVKLISWAAAGNS